MNTRTDAVGVLRRLLSQREQALSWARSFIHDSTSPSIKGIGAEVAALTAAIEAMEWRPVCWRYLRPLGGDRFAWTRWQPMEDLHHYGADGNLVPGPHPDWHKVEYAYAPPAAADGRTNEEKK